MERSVGGVGVLDKAVVILAALEVRPLALADLVEATGLSRATAHRLASALEAHGIVRRDDEGRFALGFRLIELGREAAESVRLADVSRPALTWLRDETGESTQLYVRDGERRVCVAALESPHGLRTIVPLGAALPLAVGSAGRVLVDGVDWAESVGEREPGVASVSAAVRDGSGVVAAVSGSGPVDRTTRHPARRYLDAVEAAARRIERAAGLTPP